MNELFNVLLNYIKPIIKVSLALGTPLALILGAIQDPDGAINSFLIIGIDLISSVFPSTPEDLKIASIINSLGDSLPLVGKAVIFEILQTIGVIISITAIIKIYKLIPFKAT